MAGRLRARAGKHPPKQKLRFDKIPVLGLSDVAEAMTFGEDKRPAGDDWRLKPVEHHIACLMRHLYAHCRGESRDPDGQKHMASVAARAMMVLELEAHLKT